MNMTSNIMHIIYAQHVNSWLLQEVVFNRSNLSQDYLILPIFLQYRYILSIWIFHHQKQL